MGTEGGQRRRVDLRTFGFPAGVVLAFLVAAWSRRFTTDDAFINYRVVHQVLAGHGPVFNVGDRVEATTSSLWLAVLTVADALTPFRLEWTSVVLEVAFGVVGLVAAMAGALRLAGLRDGARPAGLVLPVGAVAYLALSGAWDWATGGLENGLTLAWLGVTFLAVVQLIGHAVPSRRRLLGTAVLVGLGFLVRPDLAVFTLGFAPAVVVGAWRHRARRGLLVAGAAAFALPAVVQLFRMGYYAALFPNTLYAKETLQSSWSNGWHYLRDFTGTYWLAVPAIALAVWLATSARSTTREWRIVVVGVEIAAALHAFGIVRAGGDYLHARLLLPSWFAMLLPVFAVRARVAFASRVRLAALLVVAGWAVVAIVACRPPSDTDPRWLLVHFAKTPHPIAATDLPDARTIGARLHALDGQPGFHLLAGDTVRTWPSVNGRSIVTVEILGINGYLAPLDMWVQDRLGLADVVVSRVKLEHRGRPGHEKILTGPWVAAAYVSPRAPITDGRFAAPDYISANSAGVDATQDPDRFAGERVAATEAMRCGALGELLDDVRGPLTARRFLGNIVDAVRLRTFRFPSSPDDARARLCR